VDFVISEDYDNLGSFELLERISPTIYLAIAGEAVGSLKSSSMEGSLDGVFTVFNASPFLLNDPPLYPTLNNLVIGNCKSSGHRFLFERTLSALRR
jgi:hypothetical protein